MSFDCVVIGGGAAGLTAAIRCKHNGLSTLIIEHTGKLAVKLLKTGNGRCNFSNMNMTAQMYQNNNSDYCMDVIRRFDVDAVIDFFGRLGVAAKNRNGYFYPRSDMASSVVSALVSCVDRLDIPVYYNTSVTEIKKADAGYTLKLTGEKNSVIKTATIIIACGSAACPSSGSDGSGYELACMLGHSVVEPLPALTALISDKKHIKTASGVRALGCVSIISDGETLAADTGEIQFTDYGISGIPVFQVSRHAVKAVHNKKKVTAVINLAPDMDKDSLVSLINAIAKERYTDTINDALSGVFNRKLVNMVCKDIGIDCDNRISKLAPVYIERLADTLTVLQYRITGFKGFDYAQVCQGGVEVKELTENLESIYNPGVFFAGEIVDIDGMCGGYNLQWAWSSGAVSADGAQDYVRRME